MARDTAAWRCDVEVAVSSVVGGGGDRCAGQGDLNLQVDGAVLQRLEAADLAAELLARLHVVERHREGSVHQAEKIGGAGHDGVFQRVRCVAVDRIGRCGVEDQRAEVSAILGLLEFQRYARRITLHQCETALHGDQEGIGAGRHWNEHLTAVEPAVPQHGLAERIDAVWLLLPGRQDDALAGEHRREMIERQKLRRHRSRDQRLRHQPGAEFLGQAAELARAEARAAGFFGDAQTEPTHFAHLAPDAAIEAGFGEAKCANALEVARARRNARRAVLQHLQVFERIRHGGCSDSIRTPERAPTQTPSPPWGGEGRGEVGPMSRILSNLPRMAIRSSGSGNNKALRALGAAPTSP